MLQTAQRTLDAGLNAALDEAGLVGPRLREDLVHELKSKIVLRSGRDPIEIIGSPGTGKHMVAQAAHIASQALLERDGSYVTFCCEEASQTPSQGISEALKEAQGGTLILERFGALREHQQRSILRHIDTSDNDTLLISLREVGAGPDSSRSADLPSPIRLKPLHEREDDVWTLIDHFFASCVADAAHPDFTARCRGFSRQAKADIAQAVESVGLASVRQLRVVVRDIVFAALSLDDLPLKIKSDQVRPYLEERYGQTQAMREARDAESIGSRFDALIDRSLLEQLAEVHGVPAKLMARQAELVAEITSYIDDMPRSYRNILDRAEDIQRAGLWLMTGARTQAEFRRHFGEERYMRPTKSVAWAFYNRVFKRDM